MPQFNHPFNEMSCSHRLLWEYEHHNYLIIGIDFDNTIRTYKEKEICSEVVELLKRCSDNPKMVLCLWSICPEGEEQSKVDFCKSLGINIDYINDSPLKLGDGKKQFFNVLLDDRAGLESAYNNLKYVLDNENKI